MHVLQVLPQHVSLSNSQFQHELFSLQLTAGIVLLSPLQCHSLGFGVCAEYIGPSPLYKRHSSWCVVFKEVTSDCFLTYLLTSPVRALSS